MARKLTEQYVLMHKDTPVATVLICTATGKIAKLGEIHNVEHLPICGDMTKGFKHMYYVANFKEWWQYSRMIPTERGGIKRVLSPLDMENIGQMVFENFGLTMSDHYWIKQKSDNLKWSEVSFFNRSFNSPVEDILMREADSGILHFSETPNLYIPSVTLVGRLPKKWAVRDGQNTAEMTKGGSKPNYQEPANEVIAASVASRLNASHVLYTMEQHDGLPYSVCKCFIDKDKELVTACQIMGACKKKNNESMLQHYLRCCEILGIDRGKALKSVAEIFLVDSTIANDDRHLNNFGWIRNPDTLEFLDPAPMYDSGNSLWFDENYRMQGNNFSATCPLTGRTKNNLILEARANPFCKTHNRQVTETVGPAGMQGIYDREKMYGLVDEANDKLKLSQLKPNRRDTVLYGLEKRITITENIANKSKDD